jgi:Effector Associated Constant Component 1
MGAVRGSLRVEVDAGPGTSAEELAQLCGWLRDELLELDVDAVDAARGGQPPTGTKGAAESIAGTLIVTLSNSTVLVALAAVLRSWVSRGKGRKVTIRLGEDLIEVSEASAEDQARLIESWMERRAGQ